MNLRTVAWTCVVALAGCASNPSKVRSGFDFSKVKRVSIVPFQGNGGSEATNAFVRCLVHTGLEVTDEHHPGDLVISGVVTEYRTDKTSIVYLGKSSLVTPAGQTLDVINPV